MEHACVAIKDRRRCMVVHGTRLVMHRDAGADEFNVWMSNFRIYHDCTSGLPGETPAAKYPNGSDIATMISIKPTTAIPASSNGIAIGAVTKVKPSRVCHG